jgi:beta-lactamase class A
LRLATRAWALSAALLCVDAAVAADWPAALRAEVERIDRQTPGQMGVYVKRLDTGDTFALQADRPWYLASAVKAPIAIGVLQEIEAGKGTLATEIKLEAADKVDGSGDMVWQDDGSSRSVETLLERMLVQSDNTAANMLLRAFGVDTLNKRARAAMGAEGYSAFTTFTDVRYGVYGELHPDARKLTNKQLVEVAAARLGPDRVEAVRRTLKVEKSALVAKTMDEAYARYYARNANTATLKAYGGMLEKLVQGKLLSPQHTTLLYKAMKFDTYDAYRLEAGLPKDVRFIHKTGTQLGRACHMGVINPQDGGREAIVVAACAEGLDESKEAGKAFEDLGKAITKTLLTPQRAR